MTEPPSGGSFEHRPVLLREAVDSVMIDPRGLYLDATLGLGGHSRAMLERLSPEGRLMGLDADPQSLHEASRRLPQGDERLRLVRGNFRSIGDILERERFFPLAGALFDLGVSSMHFEDARRGFSLALEGPLDMRLSPDIPLTAEAIVNSWPEEQLSLLLKEFGEEPASRRIARAIVRRRAHRPFKTTTDLAEHIASLLPRGRVHAATRTFMALRIAVNAELESLTRGIEGVLPYLQHGGRLAVISFHSLEDRIVKRLFSSLTASGQCRSVAKTGAIRPSDVEVESNARARSAKLRVVEKL